MKNIPFWKLLGLVLIVVCLFGCSPGEEPPSENGDLRPDNGSWPPPNGGSSDEGEVVEQIVVGRGGGEADDKIVLEEVLKELEELLDEERKNVPVKDHVPPIITDSNIAPGAKNVGRNTRLWIKFNEPINDADLVLETDDGEKVETLLIFRNDSEVELIKLAEGEDFHLKANTVYVIKGKVSDDAGNETKVEITFTTGVGLW